MCLSSNFCQKRLKIDAGLMTSDLEGATLFGNALIPVKLILIHVPSLSMIILHMDKPVI